MWLSQVNFAGMAPVIDTLNSLLDAEAGNIFHFLEESRPYINRATPQLRGPLLDMVQTSDRHARELGGMVKSLGGHPSPRHVIPEEQYLAVLSFEFMLPKLLDAKRLMITRYENALVAIPNAPRNVIGLLRKHITEHQADAKLLEQVVQD